MKAFSRRKRRGAQLARRRERFHADRVSARSRHGSRRGEAGKIAPHKAVAQTRGLAARGRLEKRSEDAEHAVAVKNFEAAARYLQKHNYRKAGEIFEKLANSGPPDVADRARVYLRMCEQKLGLVKPAARTAGDYHILGVSELNAGNLESAIAHLSKAHKMEPQREDIRYALAAAHALQGDADVAIEHLKAAIALRPQNRFQARADEDFQSLARDPRFQSLVYLEASRHSRVTS